MRSIKSLEKGLQILEIMSNYSDGVRIKDIVDDLAEPISNISLFLNSMINVGFIAKNPDSGRYFITQKLAEIARKAEKTQYAQLKQISLPEMTALRDEFNENVLLAVLDTHDMHFIERLQSNRTVQIQENRDIYYPPHVTAAGKAILAFLDKSKQDRYLSEALYHKFTDKSLINPKMLREELEQIHTAGYAVNRGEFESEIMAVACPILEGGTAVASIVVQYPTFRYQAESLPDFASRIGRSARAIEAALGGIQP